MKYIYSLILVTISSISIAQNWNLIDANKTYFYKHSDSLYITNTIKVDNTEISGSDTTYSLHTTIKVCDTCTLIPSYAVGGILYHAFWPELFGLSPSFSGSTNEFIFQDGTIKHKAELSDSWVFHTTSAINATVVDKYETTLFGSLDSVKVIELSTLDTIIISKNHGIIRYPDFENAGKYFLQVGYHEGLNSFGEYLPNARTIYDFAAGDEFCYQFGYGDSGFSQEMVGGNLKFKILADNSSMDTINYQVKYYHQESHSYYGPNLENEGFPTYNTAGITFYNFKIDDNPDYVENSYGIFSADLFGTSDQFYYPVWVFPFPNYNCSDVAGSEIGFIDHPYSNYFGYIKRVRTFVLFEDTLCYFPIDNQDQDRKFANGFGSIHYSYFCFETNQDHHMTSFVKDGDTLETLCYFPEDLASPSDEKNHLKLYPNPATNQIHLDANYQEVQFYSLTGQLILQIQNPGQTIAVGDLTNGIYIVKVIDVDGNLLTTKLIIE
ncbi:MAG: T9SS type A sorting domain-containing protein [Crocinitomicaceae bacterium]|nr:T9SS type A sorting domain-containing protein [Crocinitomicaceae bacterium]